MKVEICNILQIRECTHDGKYLGMHFCKTKSKKKDSHEVIGKNEGKTLRVGDVILLPSWQEYFNQVYYSSYSHVLHAMFLSTKNYI